MSIFCHCEETLVDVAIVCLFGVVESSVYFVDSSYGLSRSAHNDILDDFVIERRLRNVPILSLRGGEADAAIV